MQSGAELFGDNSGLDHRHAGPTAFLGHQETGCPEVGETAPDRIVDASRIVEQLAHVARNRRLLGKEAAGGVAQRDLLVGEFEVHFRGSPRTRCAVMFLLIWVVPPAMVSERDVRR